MRRKGSAGCDREGEERGGGGKADRPEKRKKKAVGLGGCGVASLRFPQKKAEKLPNFTVLRQFRFVVSGESRSSSRSRLSCGDWTLGVAATAKEGGKNKKEGGEIWGWKEEELLTRFDPA